MKNKKKEIVERLCDAFRYGMKHGLSMDEALVTRGLSMSIYQKYSKNSCVMAALADGESARKAHWEMQMRSCAFRPGVNYQIVIKMYEACIKNAEERPAAVPRINVFNVKDRKQKKTLKKKINQIKEDDES